MTADAVIGSNFNRYWYANDNPYRFKDIDGRLGQDVRGSPVTDAAAIKYFSGLPSPMPGAAEKSSMNYKDGTSVPLNNCTNSRCTGEVPKEGASFMAHTHEASMQDGEAGYITNQLRELPTLPGDDAVLNDFGVPNYIRTPTDAVRVLEKIDDKLLTRTVKGNDNKHQSESRESSSDRKNLIIELKREYERQHGH